MQIVRTRRELQDLADKERSLGRRIALVPTMGALHAGHLALVDEGRRRADRVWVSIFVNPTQFNDPSDYEQYPATWDDDVRACERAGVDVVYAPHVDEVYPDGDQTKVEVSALAEPLCGATRPGHFRGVTTVVARLFAAAKPHVGVFGEKDFQQLAVIRRMTRDLGFDVEVVGVPTVREADGLALSSRNVHLGSTNAEGSARQQALCLVRALDDAEAAIVAGERRAARLLQVARTAIAESPLAEIDYCELRDPETLEPAPEELAGPTLLALAVTLPARAGEGQRVRLIDNRVLLRAAPRKPEATEAAAAAVPCGQEK